MPFPLSRNQKALYFEQLLNRGTTIYNIGAVISVIGPLQVHTFRDAARAASRRFPELATRVFELDGNPVQTVPEVAEPELQIVDVSACDGPEEEARRQISCD